MDERRRLVDARYSGNPGSAVPIHRGDVNPNSAPYGQSNVPGWNDNQLLPPYGTQSWQTWATGENDRRDVLDLRHTPQLWKVAAFGHNVTVDITYGTKGSKRLLGLLTPLILFLPGQVNVSAKNVLSDEGIPLAADVQITATLSSSGKSAARYVLNGGTQFLPNDATSFLALEPTVLHIGRAAIVVNLAALQSVPLVAGSEFISGGGYVEFET